MKLTALAAKVLGIDEETLSDTSSMENTSNWDSARHIDLLLSVEVAYGVQFSMAEIKGMTSIGALRAVLEEKGAEPLAA